MQKKYIVLFYSFFIILFLVGVGFRANVFILSYNQHIVADVAHAPERDIALVFGGGMIDKDTMSPYQYDRVLKAIELYKSGKVEKLIMTGDNGEKRFDEVNVMKKMAIDAGVPEENIETDGKSFRTYLSCLRAKEQWEFDRVIAISQQFHLPRIRYFCESFGIETVGLSADLRE